MPIYNDIPIIGKYLKSRKFLDKLSLEEREKIQNEYRNLIGLGADVTFSSNAFDTLDKSRITDIQGFSKTLGPDGKSILERLNANQGVKSEIAEALKPSDAYKQGKNEFEESIATFQDLVKQVPQKFSVEDLLETMKNIKDDAVAAIKAQKDKEIQALNDLFSGKDKNSQDFREALGEAFQLAKPLNASSEKDLELIKNNMITDLEASHTKQRDDFEKSTADSLKQLQDGSATENKQVVFAALLSKLNNENRIYFQQKAMEQAQATGSQINVKQGQIKISGSPLKNLPKFTSITGKDIVQNPPGSGTYTIQMSRNIFSPLYYLDPRESLQTDYRLMLKALMAEGKDNFTWTFDYDDQESVMAHAREAYKASIEEGVDPAKIKMQDAKGNDIKPGEAFKDQPSVLKKLQQRSAEVRNELEKANEKPKTATNQAAVKAEIKDLREKKKVTYDIQEPPTAPKIT